MPENRYKLAIQRQASNKEGTTIVYRAWNALTKIQSTSVEVTNQESKSR